MERSQLSRRLVFTLCLAIPIALVSAWLFYDLYWKWRVELSGGQFTDPDGRLLYREFAIWGAMSVISFGLSVAAAFALWRLGPARAPRGKRFGP